MLSPSDQASSRSSVDCAASSPERPPRSSTGKLTSAAAAIPFHR